MPFENPFSKKKEAPALHERILPSDVRYAFQYKEAKLNVSEMADLVENGFEQEALYLILKSSVGNPELQQQLLQQTVDTVLSGMNDEESQSLRSFLRYALTQLPGDTAVEAQKLALISRQGFDLWHQMYAESARRLALSEVEVFVLAHSTFVGLPTFIENFSKVEKPLQILTPEFFENAELDISGYVIKDGVVSFLPKDFERPQNALIVDDVKNTGATTEQVRAFWKRDEHAEYPTFEVLLETKSSI